MAHLLLPLHTSFPSCKSKRAIYPTLYENYVSYHLGQLYPDRFTTNDIFFIITKSHYSIIFRIIVVRFNLTYLL